MEKVEIIKNMATTILNNGAMINPDEFESLIEMSESQIEKELYYELFNFFLRKKSEEVIKNEK